MFRATKIVQRPILKLTFSWDASLKLDIVSGSGSDFEPNGLTTMKATASASVSRMTFVVTARRSARWSVAP